MTHTLLFLDVETSGLDPRGRDLLLEIGLAYRDRDGATHTYSSLVNPLGKADSIRPYVERFSDEVVIEMHRNSGLLADLEDADPALFRVGAVEASIHDWLATLPIPEGDDGKPIKLTPAGYSVHFDVKWIASWLPIFGAKLHPYRIREVTSIAQFLKDTIGVDPKDRENDAAHRALPDALHALRTYLEAQELVKRPSYPPGVYHG